MTSTGGSRRRVSIAPARRRVEVGADEKCCGGSCACESVVIRKTEVHRDARGDVREVYRASWNGGEPVRQMVRTASAEGALRGMHYHKRQFDAWHFTEGRALVQLYDPATGWHRVVVAEQDTVLVIPPGIAHGWQALEPTVLIYGLGQEYDGGSDEYGFDPLDGEFPGSVLWRHPYILSERDRNAPSVREFVNSL